MSRREREKVGPELAALHERFVDQFGKDAGPILQRASDLIVVREIIPGALDRYATEIEDGASAFTASNHISLADALAEAKKAMEVRVRTKGFLENYDLVIAKSLAAGRQGSMNSLYFEQTAPFLNDRGINMDLEITTRNDIRNGRGERSKVDLEEVYFGDAPYDRKGFAIYLEGTQKGGRRDQDGNIYGMRPIPLENLGTQYIRAVLAKGGSVVILPSAIVGTNQLVNPSPPFYPRDEALPYLLGDVEETPQNIDPIELLIGEPFVIWRTDQVVNGDDLARGIAELLHPEYPEYAGVYAATAEAASS